ncbi:MAG: exodeoxyribonuclease VII small subunit [Faecalibacterium sp.]|nr:exodeoxyribonuclease VII small subunit [Faecalibacterium sp.]
MKTPKTFEEGAARLEEILAKIGEESTPLAEAVKLYAEAAELMAFCSASLDDAKLKIEEIDAKLPKAAVPEEQNDDTDGI